MQKKIVKKVITVAYVYEHDFLENDKRNGFTFSDSKRERFFIPAIDVRPTTKIPINVLTTMVNLSQNGYTFEWNNKNSNKRC